VSCAYSRECTVTPFHIARARLGCTACGRRYRTLISSCRRRSKFIDMLDRTTKRHKSHVVPTNARGVCVVGRWSGIASRRGTSVVHAHKNADNTAAATNNGRQSHGCHEQSILGNHAAAVGHKRRRDQVMWARARIERTSIGAVAVRAVRALGDDIAPVLRVRAVVGRRCWYIHGRARAARLQHYLPVGVHQLVSSMAAVHMSDDGSTYQTATSIGQSTVDTIDAHVIAAAG
jgi:hypothetical protein